MTLRTNDLRVRAGRLGGMSPLILHLPHASSLIPAADREDFLLSDGELAAEGRRLVDAHTDLATFVFERLSGMMREQGFSSPEVDAVICMRPDNLGQIPKLLEAVRAFAALPESPALAAANKRIGNILKRPAR